MKPLLQTNKLSIILWNQLLSKMQRCTMCYLTSVHSLCGRHINYSTCNLLLKPHSYTHTHTRILSLCFPEHCLHSLCCSLFESCSVILDQRVQRAPECWWCKHCVQCLPHRFPLSRMLPREWDGTGRTILIVADTEDYTIDWYSSGTGRLMAACLLCLRGLLLMTCDTVGKSVDQLLVEECG